LIKKAYLQEYSEAFTDDATVLESTGERIVLVDGNRENIKITTPEDLLLAETLLPFVP
jgi:2-C-methyl-D-erythritol 4-phosphate cytidylyltransferase